MKHSIIVTGYNCELYAEECINSLLSQTYQLFEILIYNDGSNDNTLEILKKFENNPKIKIFNNDENKGALFGRFNLNKIATGDIISFVGLDDLLSPNALEVLNLYYKKNIKMSYGNWVDYNSNIVNDIQEYSDDVFTDKTFRKSKWKATALNTFRKTLLDSIPENILKYNGEFFQNCTDLAYSFPCLEQCKKDEVAVIKESIYIYRSKHPNTTLKRLGKQNKSEIREYLKNQNIFTNT
jgi:glycosyltransferase involved in cell wall biosynthesis